MKVSVVSRTALSVVLFSVSALQGVAQKEGFTNGFAFRLMNEVGTEQTDNVVLSPLSLHFGLSLLQNGARGNTQEEIRRLLGAEEMSVDELNTYNRGLCKRLLEEPAYKDEDCYAFSFPWDELPRIDIANAVWVDELFSVRPQFSGSASYWYGATVENVDFAQQSSVDRIGGWYADHTDGRITTVGEEPNGERAMMLTGTILFDGKWADIFSKKDTHDATFTNADGTCVTVPTMFNEGDFLVSDNANFYMVKLPCFPLSSGRFSMCIYLPRLQGAVLTEEDYNELHESISEEITEVYLPKFTIRQDIHLRDALEQLGLHDVFSKEDADFTQLIRSGLQCPYLDEVNQICEISVHEYGVSAVAATSYSFIGWGPIDGRIIRFDRPFFYTIEDGNTNTILFLGKVNHLEGTSAEQPKGDMTGIGEMETPQPQTECYSLDGRAIDGNARGIVIENGRKVLK